MELYTVDSSVKEIVEKLVASDIRFTISLIFFWLVVSILKSFTMVTIQNHG